MARSAILIFRERAPLDRLVGEQRHEELGADAVDVGVGRRDGEPFDMHDEHMRVGRADVVLDGEAGADAAGGRFEPRMAESELRGAVEAAHEGAHAGAAGIVEAVHARAVDVFDRGRRGDPVQRLVQVHDEQMQAVVAPAPRRGELGDLTMGDAVALEIGQAPRASRRGALFSGAAPSGSADLDRRHHRRRGRAPCRPPALRPRGRGRCPRRCGARRRWWR